MWVVSLNKLKTRVINFSKHHEGMVLQSVAECLYGVPDYLLCLAK